MNGWPRTSLSAQATELLTRVSQQQEQMQELAEFLLTGHFLQDHEIGVGVLLVTRRIATSSQDSSSKVPYY